jgi:hypothetical protein
MTRTPLCRERRISVGVRPSTAKGKEDAEVRSQGSDPRRSRCRVRRSRVVGRRGLARQRNRECKWPVPARQQGRSDQARDLPPVRQHALQARQPQRPVRSRADAAPAQLPQKQRHARHQRPHDPDLAYRRRHPRVADGAVSRSQRPDGLEQLRLLLEHRRTVLHVVVQVLDGHGRRDERNVAQHGRRRRPDHTGTVAHLHGSRLQRRRRVGRQHRAREQLHGGVG